MSKIKFISLIKNIRKTFVSYISIVIFVTMGITAFCSMSWSGKAFEQGVNEYYKKYNYRDVELVFNLGATDDIVEELNKTDNIDNAEGIYESYGFTQNLNKNYHVKLAMISRKIDKLSSIIGTLPNAENQIAVERFNAEKLNIKIGDEIVFKNDKNARFIKTTTFTVTALVESPNYLSIYPISYGYSTLNPTPIDLIMFLDESAFNESEFNGYTSVLLTCESLKQFLTSSNEYKSEVEKLFNSVLDEKSEISYNVTAIPRYINGGYIGAETTFGMYDKLKYTMAILFIIIGVLVSFSTISRIVFEQKKLIGTKKAFGFSNKSVIFEYLTYVFSAVLIGAILGLILSRFIVEPIFLNIMVNNFAIEKISPYFSFIDFLAVFIIEFSVIILSAIIACSKVGRQKAVTLLNGGDEKVHATKRFEKTKIWQNLSLIKKTIINNFIKDKRRVFATLVGILGCTSLIVCGLSFYSGLIDGESIQFDKLQSFGTVVYYDMSVDSCENNIQNNLNENGVSYCKAFSSIGKTEYNNRSTTTSVFVYDEKDINGLFNIYSLDGKKQKMGDKIWISSAFAEENKLKEGDYFNFYSQNGIKYQLKIGGIFEFYLLRTQIIMSLKTYENVFNAKCEYNSFLVDRTVYDTAKIENMVKDIDGFIQADPFYDNAMNSFTTIISVGYGVCGLYLVLSVIMAFLVLLNILIMFIEEKKRELIIMRINGYTFKNVKKYIYGDTILLSFIGIILGVFLGCFVGILTLKSIATDTSIFVYEINFLSCLLGVILSVVLFIIVSVIATKRIKKFNLSDINK